MQVYLFCLGAVTASFVYCTAWRLSFEPNNWWRGRSICDHCLRSLTWWQLIPILGWLFQKGRCHFCQQYISWQSLFWEIGLGAFTTLLQPSQQTDWLFWSILVTLLFASLIDFWQKELYIWCLVPTGVWALMIKMPIQIHEPEFWLLISFLAIILCLATLTNGLGLGDFDLLLYWGCFFDLTTILLATFLGSCFAWLHNRRRPKNYRIPLIPYLCLGLITSLLIKTM